ncbi:DMT family transporter [Halococcus thailandensis]|nr:DMT family transporter [Halococcus thailandensis]
MDTVVVGLALLTAMSWGISDPLSKAGMERGGTPLLASIVVVSVSVIGYWLSLVIRGFDLFALPLWVVGAFFGIGLVSTGLARLLNYVGVERAGASVNSATVNTRPLWATILAIVFLGESITAQGVVGILCVVSGLGLVAFSGGGDITGWNKRDLLFPLGAALTFAFGNVARRYLFTNTGATPLDAVALNELAGLVGLLSFILYSQRGQLRSFFRIPREAYAYFVGCGIFSALALFGLFAALERGQVTVVDPLSSPTSLFAILVTVLFFRQVESITRRLLVGAVLVISGVVLITGPQFLTL